MKPNVPVNSATPNLSTVPQQSATEPPPAPTREEALQIENFQLRLNACQLKKKISDLQGKIATLEHNKLSMEIMQNKEWLEKFGMKVQPFELG